MTWLRPYGFSTKVPPLARGSDLMTRSTHLASDDDIPCWAEPTPTWSPHSRDILLGFIQRIEAANPGAAVRWKMPKHGIHVEWGFDGDVPTKWERGIYLEGVFSGEDFEIAEPALAKVVHDLRKLTPVLVRTESFLGPVAVGITFVIPLGIHEQKTVTPQDVIDVVFGNQSQ